jgi:hypothetical protein
MKKVSCRSVYISFAVIYFLIIGSNSIAFADFSIQGNTVYDDVSKQYWVRDLSMFSYQTYQQQLSTIANLNTGGGYSGLTNWHMASFQDVWPLFSGQTGVRVDRLFEPSGISQYSVPSVTWFGRYEGASRPGYHYGGGALVSNFYNPETYFQEYPDNYSGYTVLSAWVIAAAPATNPDSTPTPIPPAFLLMGSGLVGMVAYRRRLAWS